MIQVGVLATLVVGLVAGCEARPSIDGCPSRDCVAPGPAHAQPSVAQPVARRPEPSPAHEPTSAPTPKLLLRIDPTMPARLAQLDPLFDIPIHDCAEPPVGCGLTPVCRELDRRWTRQLEREFGPLPSVADELADRRYVERCEPERRRPDTGDFSDRAIVLRDLVIGNFVEGLLVETDDGWRGLARTTEQIGEGMAMLIAHYPVAAWQLDVDGVPGDELIVLVRGRDSGHASDKDPFVRARVIFCGTAPRTARDRGPWCGRVEVGAWLEDTARELVSAAQRRASWIGPLEIYSDGRLERIGAPPRRSLTLAELDRADQRLIPAGL